MSLRIFHLSDLHIGLKLFNYDLREDQIHIFDQIVKAAEEKKPDAIIIAGDIYDKAVPSAEAVDVFDYFLSEIAKALPNTHIMMISGNHDSASRINVFRKVLRRRNIHMIGIPPRMEDEYIEKVVLQDEYGDVNFYLLPFVKPSMVRNITGSDENGNSLSYNEAIHRLIERENIDVEIRNVLVSHQFYLPQGMKAEEVERSDYEVRTVGNIDSICGDVLEVFDYAALGHIHKPMKVGSDFYRYCGTPMQYSISESGQTKGIIMVDFGPKGEISTEVIELKPLRYVRSVRGELEEVLMHPSDDFVSVVLTDKKDLDVIDMKDRLRQAFPYLLEIQRTGMRSVSYSKDFTEEKELDMYELCSSFLDDLDDEEKKLLKDVINTVEGVRA